MLYSIIMIFLAAVLTQNIALTYLLGLCPFISLSRSIKTAVGKLDCRLGTYTKRVRREF